MLPNSRRVFALLHPCVLVLVLWNPSVALSQDANAAADSSLSDVDLLSFACANLDVPVGGHVQGIQIRFDAEQHRYLAFLSHDSVQQAYVVVVAFDESLSIDGKVIHVHRFAEGRLRHAGGIQLHDNLLAVGLEDNRSKDRSEVQFWDTTDPADWDPLRHLTIARRGPSKEQTAGAVGFAALNDCYLVAVANWDSVAIDFYRSNTLEVTNPSCRFRQVTRWTQQDADRKDWKPNNDFGRCQAINLTVDGDSQITMYGFHQNRHGNDVADRFRVNLQRSPGQTLTRISSTICSFPGDCHFKYGGGISMQNGHSWILSTPRNLGDIGHIAVLK